MATGVIEASLDGASQFSAEKKIQTKENTKTQVSIFGTLTNTTVSVQIRRDPSDSFRTIDTFTSATEQTYNLVGPVRIRAGIESGNHGSGTVEVEIA